MSNEPEKQSSASEPPPPTPEPPASETPPPGSPVANAQGANPTNEQHQPDAGDVLAAAEKINPAALVAGEMPEPSEHVVAKFVRPHRPEPKPDVPSAKAESGQNGRSAVGEEWRDKTGERFVPTKHQHRHGKPELTPKGYLKRWGAKHRKEGIHLRVEGLSEAPESSPSSEEPKKESFWEKAKKAVGLEREKEPEPSPEPQPGPTPPPEPEFRNNGFIGQVPAAPDTGKGSGSSEASQAASQLVAMEEMIAVMVFSEEWQFLDEERKGLVTAWTRAFEEKGIVETPWWMELGAAHAVVFASRANKPKTREKLGKMKGAFMKRVIDFRTARAPQQKEASNG